MLVVVLALGLGGGVAHGQRPPAGGGAGTPLLIDFTAATADGKAVADLTAADVAVRIGGKARTVSSLELKKIAAPAPAAPGASTPAATDITPPFFTNEAKAAAPSSELSRAFLIVIDNESLSSAAEGGMKSAIEGLLKGLNSNDRVALSTLPRDTAQVGFGTGLVRVREAVTAVRLQKLAGEKTGNEILQSKQSNFSDSEKNIIANGYCRTSQTLAVLNSMLQQLAGSAMPTNVIVIAGNLSMPGKETGSAGTCEVLPAAYQTIGDTAAEVRATFHVVQGDSGVMGSDQGLDQLAGVTGAGQVMRVSGDGFAPRVLADSSTYWVATIAPDPADRPGQAQRLEVKVSRAGVTVHARSSAAVPRMAPAAAAAKPGAASPKDMISSPAQFTDLQLRAAAIVQRGVEDKFTILVQAEPVDPAVKITAMRVGYFDQTNKGASLDSPKATTYPITTAFAVTAGQYRVRVAATDANGKSGAVDVTVNTAFTAAGPLKVSSLMVGAPEGASGMKPQLTFSNEEKVIVYLQLYGQLTAGISVKFELAKSDAGPAIETFPPSGGGPTNEPDKLQVFGEVPIAKLEPGDYVIRAVVQMEGQPEGKVLRTIRKAAK
jgi:hypothetical protein